MTETEINAANARRFAKEFLKIIKEAESSSHSFLITKRKVAEASLENALLFRYAGVH